MPDIKRKYSEIVSIAKLEPGLKNIYVEGLSDLYFLKNFLTHHKVSDVLVYEIDCVDFSELYEVMDKDSVKLYSGCNKERVILLAESLENDVSNEHLSSLCVVDTDWDIVIGNVRTGLYLSYTDYNSMDMYLFSREVLECYLRQGHRIATIESANLLDSLATVCRQLFHIHCLLHENQKKIVDNTKDLSFDKSKQVCSLDFSEYWRKTLAKNGLTAQSANLLSQYNNRMANLCDVRKEIRGHDYVNCLYFCTKKLNSKMGMNVEEFANMFWKFADYDILAQEPLFQRILNL